MLLKIKMNLQNDRPFADCNKKITYLKLALDKSKKTVNLNITVKNFTCE